MRIEIELIEDQIDSIIVDDLREYYLDKKDDNPELAKHIDRLLRYYSTIPDHEAWLENPKPEIHNQRGLSIAVAPEDISKIVANDLRWAFEWNKKDDKIDCSDDIIERDEDLLIAIVEVLSYYMVLRDYVKWKEENEQFIPTGDDDHA